MEEDIECEQNGFWSWLEEPPMDAGDEETNKLAGIIGIVLGHLGALAGILAYIWPAFLGGIAAITWNAWIFISLFAISLGFQIWGLIVFLNASGNSNAATTFRAWRMNFIFQAAHAIIQFLSFWIWFIVILVAGGLIAALLYMGLFIGALLFAGLAVWLMFFIKQWWYLYDEEGMMRCDESWEFFGNDDDYEEMEEEEEVVEEETEEEEVVEEEEW